MIIKGCRSRRSRTLFSIVGQVNVNKRKIHGTQSADVSVYDGQISKQGIFRRSKHGSSQFGIFFRTI